jgi:hypothetical protein
VAQNTGRILTRTLISEKIWVSEYDVDTNLLDVYMSRLRAKLETSSTNPLFKTILGVGYQLLWSRSARASQSGTCSPQPRRLLACLSWGTISWKSISSTQLDALNEAQFRQLKY